MESARPAVRADAARLAVLVARGRDELRPTKGGALWDLREAWPAPDAEALGGLVGRPDVLMLVGEFDGQAVGAATARLEELPDGTLLARVDTLYVEPEFRDVGVGEALMDAVLAWCEARGCRGVDAVALPGNRATKNFFERFGLVARAIVVHRPLGAFARSDRPGGQEEP